MPRSSGSPPKAKTPKAQFLRFTSPERTALPGKRPGAMRAGIPRPHTRTQRGRSRPSWSCRSGTPMPSATTRCAPSSTAWEFRRCGCRSPTTTFAARQSWSASDYAVSANIGRTLSACRQAVVDIRCCIDWLEDQGYEHFGVLGTSLGSCYGFLASAHDKRIRVNAFNHASTAFGDVVWAGQSTRHVKQALDDAGMTQDRVRALWSAISPVSYYDQHRRAKRRARTRRFCLSTPTTISPFPEGIFAEGG